MRSFADIALRERQTGRKKNREPEIQREGRILTDRPKDRPTERQKATETKRKREKEEKVAREREKDIGRERQR